jgi:hypothetical protein
LTAWLAERRLVLATAVCSRLLVLAAAVAGHALHWPRPPTAVPGSGSTHILGLLGYWDGVWYRTVAERGYLLIPGRQSDSAFFPLFPILLRWLHDLGLSFITSGVAIANVAFVIGIVAFYEVGRRLVPEHVAETSALFAAFFPMSFVFSMTYPESLVLAALALALLAALNGRWTLSALAGTAAALGRPEAMFFALPLAAIAVGTARIGRARGRAIGAALAPVASVATFPLYLGWALNNVFAWNLAQAAWGRSFGLDGVDRALRQLHERGQSPWLWRDACFCVIYLGLIAASRRLGLSWAWLLAGIPIVLLPVATGTFLSDARFGLLALPAYWGLAVLAPQGAARRAVVIVSAALLVAGTMTIPLATP